MNNKRGFTLIELLAVIVILGLLLAIAIPSITKYIVEARKKTLLSSINNYVLSSVTAVNEQKYKFTNPNTIYAIPIECISVEKGEDSPFGEWLQANDSYWAYVLVQYNSSDLSYTYGFTFKDSSGYGMYPTMVDYLSKDGKEVKTKYDDLTKPQDGLATSFISLDKWNGFKVDGTTELIVLAATPERDAVNGVTTCLLCQKGENYQTIEANRPKCIAKSGTGSKIGDIIACDEEEFYVIESDLSSITMLAKDKIDLTTYKQNALADGCMYSFGNYWTNRIDNKYYLKEEYGTSYPVYVFDKNADNAYKHVVAYEKYLKKIGVSSASASVISHEQLINLGCDDKNYTCNTSSYKNWIVRDYGWWTGTAFSQVNQDNLWVVGSGGSFNRQYRIYASGIRPIVTISKSDLL